MDLTMMLLFHKYPHRGTPPSAAGRWPADGPSAPRPEDPTPAGGEGEPTGDEDGEDRGEGEENGQERERALRRDEHVADVTASAQAKVAIGQGAFYVATGLWPLVSLATFELASGPKKENWLVKTTGALIAAIGGALLVGARSGARPPTSALGMLAASTLAACDVYYVARGRIAKIYLVDAAVELGLVGAWLRAAPTAAAAAAAARRGEVPA